MAESLDDLKRKSALAHRILTMTGSMGDITGHVMVRVPGTDEFLYRCRNTTDDVSPAYATFRSIHRVQSDGQPAEPLKDDYSMSGERFIGVALFRERPEVGCVIHAHPPAQVLCSVTGVDIRPIVGSQNWGGSMIAGRGVPVYPRSLTIVNDVLGRAMAAAMGGKEVVLLKGHGNVVVGRTVEEATVKAIQLENLARMCWQLALHQKRADEPFWEVPWQDVEDTASGISSREASEAQGGAPARQHFFPWAYYVRMLEERALIPHESTVQREHY